MHQKTKICRDGIRSIFLLIFLSFFTFHSSLAQNAIVTENQNPGVSPLVWDIPSQDAGDLNIQGFATDISVNKGGSIGFKVNVVGGGQLFNITIYRIGYYQGNGARLIANLGSAFAGVDQNAGPNACTFDNTNGLTDCGKWTTATTWNVPSTAVSGLYIAKLTLVSTGGTSHIPFIVRDDASNSTLLVKTSDATWQAYNGYGGYSLYVGAGMPNNHGIKVSYNRPFITRSGGGGGGANEDWFMNAEYPMIRFLESNGYDISYTTDLEISRNNANNINLLLNHKIFLSVGHDEYWSKEERNSVEAARNAGKNLAFFSGNECYWKTRWENSADGTNTPFRTMVCYKEGTLPTPQENACGGKCDLSTNEWTGLWRDGCGYPGVTDACKPENALSGQISWYGVTQFIQVPDTYKNLWFWRNTPNVSTLPAGNTYSMADGTLGYEWDWEQYENSYPPGRVTMSSVTFNGLTHKLSLYKAPSGALVFGAGTVQWAWGLDQNHDLNGQGGGGPADQNMQQATINILADMGAQAATIQGPLIQTIASTDLTPPSSVITTPLNGVSIPANNAFVIKGTAVDAGGRFVAGVDVSLDGGVTWQLATGTTNWSFSWVPTTPGPVVIKSRAFDDVANLEAPGGSEGSPNTVNITVVSGIPNNCPCSIFTPAQSPAPSDRNFNDGTQITLGTRFKSAFSGDITGIKFFRAPGDNGTDTVRLWEADGTLLQTAFLGQHSGNTNQWDSVAFTPIHINAGSVYVVSYYTKTGNYNASDFGFIDSVVNFPLTSVADSNQAGSHNGVYHYGLPVGLGTNTFPTDSYHSTNYWVDAKFVPDPLGPDVEPPNVAYTFPPDGTTGVSVTGVASATFTEDMNPASITGATIELRDNTNNLVSAAISYSAKARTVTITPSAPLNYITNYTVTVKSGSSGVKDLAGNAMLVDFTFSFTTSPFIPPPDEGAGGPLLIISSTLSPFSRYMVEILRAQGYTEFSAIDLTEFTSASVLGSYDVVLLGNLTLSSSQLGWLTTWVNAGGTLIAQRPASNLQPFMGITASGIMPSPDGAYLLVNTTGPGAGIVNVPIQYHGVADQYTGLQPGVSTLATLYTSPGSPTIYPAVTSLSVGLGKAVAFAYDLPQSVVTTRQGNPALAGISSDGQSGPIRSDNLFFNNWLDFNNVQIPQADEQQHLLTNILLQSNLHNKPLPHLWFLPSGFKAAVVMTGDDHNLREGNTVTRFLEYMGLQPSFNNPTDVADWKAIRGSAYIFNGVQIPDDSVTYFQNQGFEIALHPTTNCVDFTQGSLNADISSQLGQLEVQQPTMTPPVTNRTHCLPWSDWSSQPTVENSLGMRLDATYYYWPSVWLQNRPGMFTGSGLPMRFADATGNIIDTYQAVTQITDESGMDIPLHINTLLGNALDPTKGYYGVFTMNMHMDYSPTSPGSDAITAAAISLGVPVVSAKQMLTWLDSRNLTAFSNMTWDNLNKKLAFHLSTVAHNLQAIVPFNSADGSLIKVEKDGNNQTFTLQTIKGIQYGFFPADAGDYVATYSSVPLPVTLIQFTVTKQGDNALLNWTTSIESNNKGFEIQRSSDQSGWTVLGFVAGAGNSQTPKSYQYLDKDLPAGTYYYRLRQVDYDNRATFSKIEQVTFSGDFALELKQNRPNPFNNNTTIDIVIPRAGLVELMLYDEMGRPLQQLMNEYKMPGTYSIPVNKNGLSTGIYYYRMNALGQSLVKKMTIY